MLKKTTLIGSVIALFSLPVIASANLDTINNTNEDSAVRITSNILKPCSGSTGHYTPAHGESQTTPLQVRLLCTKTSGICTADMYPSKDCSGEKIATVSIDLSTLAVNVDQIYDTHYVITSTESKVEINYSK
ncbi:MAG: hypothetical protein ACD_45C00342G0003 [uncultured bacterium]|nr:MAG: hypothetical protein ACD_45C00342G0003 [uncultured bacterium]